jgi:hypothetical protein
MTPPAVNRSKAKPLPVPAPMARWMLFVVMLNLSGGVSGALIAFFLQKKDLAFGFFVGSLLSTLNLYALQSLTGKVLALGEGGRKWFWVWNVLRWILLAAACRLLLSISPACLLAAVGSYVWFLVVIGLVQWRSTSPVKTS